MSKTVFLAIALTAGAVFAPLNVSHAESIAAQANEAKSVIVSGTGGTRELALGNAFRHAVEQAVGMMVTSSSYVKNLREIEDKIIVGSSGFIETYNVLNEKNDVTGYAITISAVVRQQKLQEKVTETVGDTQRLSGGLLFAQQNSVENQVKLYQDTYEELIHDFVRSGLEYHYEGPPSIEKQNNGRYTIIPVSYTHLTLPTKRIV